MSHEHESANICDNTDSSNTYTFHVVREGRSSSSSVEPDAQVDCIVSGTFLNSHMVYIYIYTHKSSPPGCVSLMSRQFCCIRASS